MKKVLMSITLLLVIFVSAKTVLADTLSQDQVEIKALIKKMYAIDPDTFEFGAFGGKYKNGQVVIEGKYDPKRQCKLLEEFLIKEAVIKEVKDISCMTGNGSYFRYPSLSEAYLGSSERVEPPPQPEITIPLVNGDKAKVQALLPTIDANVMYYLRKQPEGWRIYRVESSNSDATIDNLRTRENRSQLDKIDIFPPEK